ncbi:ataxin-10-like [Littorina saxatilis]|uniref:Ataxin-10 domain-containing protein n=1 Tax=Littorina saxatilis TaxID=31220 RepID=A0AAN9GBL3_9CAEN
MSITFEENLCKCLENLKVGNFRAATSDLYPISKQTPRLGNASDDICCKFVNQMIGVLDVLKDKIGGSNKVEMEDARFFLMDAYRIMRTSCAANSQVQDEFGGVQGSKVMECTRIVLDAATQHYEGESLIQLLAVGIQFLANLATNSEKNQDLVWDHFHMQFKGWLDMTKGEPEVVQERSTKVLNITSFLIEACLPRQWQRNPRFLEEPVNWAVMVSAIQANTTWKLEFGKKCLAKLAQVPGLMKAVMAEGQLGHMERACMLTSMQDVVTEWRDADEKGPVVPSLQNNLQFLIEYLVNNRAVLAANQLEMREASFNAEMHLHVKMLETLAQASCCIAFSPDISNFTVQKDEEPKTLIMYAIGLLMDIHKKGQEGVNMLSMTNRQLDVDINHPAFMLRRDLVRIIGNLSYQNKNSQDAVREAYGKIGIPLLFDHTKLDERNPYIGEWAKLALTNLVRDNEDNAKFVKNLKLVGHVDPLGILKDCGLTLETQGEKIIVKSDGQTPTLSKLSEKTPPRP